MCTSLLMCAITQDKLAVDIDKTTFHLIVAILNMNTLPLTTLAPSPPSLPPRQRSSRTTTSSSVGSKKKCAAATADEEVHDDDDDDDDRLYKRVFQRCVGVFEHLMQANGSNTTGCSSLNSSGASDSSLMSCTTPSKKTSVFDNIDDDDDENDGNDKNHTITETKQQQHQQQQQQRQISNTMCFVNSHCILNLNMSRKERGSTTTAADWYKTELRELGVLDKLVATLKFLMDTFRSTPTSSSSSSSSLTKNYALLTKYIKYLGLIEASTAQQPSTAASSTSSSTSKSSSCTSSTNTSPKTAAATGSPTSHPSSSSSSSSSASNLNQHYLMRVNDSALVRIFAE